MAKINILTAFGQEKGKEGTFISFYTQREAKYKNAPDSVFNNKKIPQEKVGMQSYLGLMDVPSPTIKEIDGYKSDKEVNPEHDYSQDYLTFETLEDGTFSFTNKISYSLDGGTTWVELASRTQTPTITAGSNIMWKGTLIPQPDDGIGHFSSTGNFNVYGNVMSLLYGDNFANQTDLTEKPHAFASLFEENTNIIGVENLILPAITLARNSYSYMFKGCTSLTAAPTLPATTLAQNCYFRMFFGCTSLTIAPELPATTLVSQCYYGMFTGCSSLTTAPELTATTLANSCYSNMFQGCTSLTTAPELTATTLAMGCYQSMFLECTSLTTAPELPATMLANWCYQSMFYGCTNLTTAPELPATTLVDSCYSYMFQGCTSLTTAPELPATMLVDSCYSYMFQGCTSLNYIKMLATDISANGCLADWVDGVAATGTFVKNTAMTDLPTGTSGIPSGWTVVDV